MTDPRVAAIVLNWNGARLLEECLPSLLAQDQPGLEVVVADNGSSDDSREVAARLGVRFVANGANLGFSAGNNAAARVVDADRVVFVNNDMRFEPDFVSRLLRRLEEDARVFAVDARQLDWDGDAVIHERVLLRRTWSPLGIFPFVRVVQDARGGPAAWADGANIMVRKAMFDELGGFFEPLRFDLDATDLCWRAWLRGWRTVHEPGAVAYHRVGASFKRSAGLSLVRRRSQVHNEIAVAVRLFPTWLAAATVARSALRVAGAALRLRFADARARGAGMLDALRRMPALLEQRRAIGRAAVVSRSAALRRLLRQ